MDTPARVYDFSLHFVGLVIGFFVLITHLFALLRPAATTTWLTRLPRSRGWGIGLLTIGAVWFFWLISRVDLGEFSGIRFYLQILIPVLFVLSVLYVEEFLAARALGILGLLVAEPMLSAAFLHPVQGRVLVVLLAYFWLTIGLFWVGKPYLLRDQISWLTKNPLCFRFSTLVGVIYGAVLIVMAATIY